MAGRPKNVLAGRHKTQPLIVAAIHHCPTIDSQNRLRRAIELLLKATPTKTLPEAEVTRGKDKQKRKRRAPRQPLFVS